MTELQYKAIELLNAMIKVYSSEIVETEKKIDALEYLKGLVYGDEGVTEESM